jgi:hypothetical protein
MKKLLLLTAIIWLKGSLFAQSPHLCATDSLWQSRPDYRSKTGAFAAELHEFRSQAPAVYQYMPYQSGDSIQTEAIAAGCRQVVYIVPVVVHLDTSGGVVNVTNAQVEQQLDLLNERYLPHGIRFVPARKKPGGGSFNGINRFGGSFDYRYDRLGDSYAASPHYFDPEKYLNIYVVPQILSSTGDPSPVNGFNQRLPNGSGTDLLVVHYSKFGDYQSCSGCGALSAGSRGLVLVHEAGHYLGLRELWQGGCGEGNNAATCHLQGDLCCDTRPVNANYSCPPPSGNDCPYHLPIADNRENYMDYTGEDCLDNFTPDQASLMRASLELYRNKLISPQNLNGLDLDDCFASAWFDAQENFACDSGVFTLQAVQYTGAVSYRWIIQQGNIILKDTLGGSASFSWQRLLPGTFDVTLEITYGNNDKASVTRYRCLEIGDCGTPLASGQGNWYFGNLAGLRFTVGGAVRDFGPYINQTPFNINSNEGTISHSDKNGKLLFYGGGSFGGEFEVYNRNYLSMPGSPVIGDGSAMQGGAVIPVPGDTQQYYLFTVSGLDAGSFRGLRYSVIDMALDGGNGDIAGGLKDLPVPAPSGMDASPLDGALICGEQITVIPRCGTAQYWILVTNSYLGNDTTGRFILVYLLDHTGVSYHGKSGFPISDDPVNEVFAPLKASPDGNWLFLMGKLMRFDKSTAAIRLYRSFEAAAGYTGASFSADSRLLYTVSPHPEDPYSYSLIHQYDLESSSDSLSKKKVADFPLENVMVNMQLGPDNKIYLSKYSQHSLAVVHHPDSRITPAQPNACGYSYNGPLLAAGGIGGACGTGLPNMQDARAEDQVPVDFLAVDSACGQVSFYPNTPCGLNYRWHFGDGDSSSLWEPRHTYAESGTYEVTLRIDGVVMKQKSVKIGIQAQIAGDTTVCEYSFAAAAYSIAGPDPEYAYAWSIENGSINAEDPYGNVTTSWQADGYIALSALSLKNGCRAYDTLYTRINRIDSNSIASSQLLCNNALPVPLTGSAAISSYGNVSYQWQQSEDSSVWEDLSPETARDYQPAHPGNNKRYYRRLAVSGSCLNAGNAVSITPIIQNNTIQLNPPGMKTCAYGGLGEIPRIVSADSFSYLWHVSDDRLSWSEGTYYKANKDYTEALDGDSVFIFRQVKAGACISNSDTLRVVPLVKISRQPKSYATCSPFISFDIEVDNPANTPVYYQWFAADNPVFGGTILSHDPSFEVYSYPYRYHSCLLLVNECIRFSDTVEYFRDLPGNVSFPVQPVALKPFVEPGDTAVIVAAAAFAVDHHHSFVPQYIWQRSTDSFMTILSSDTFAFLPDTLRDTDIDLGKDSIWYRLLVEGGDRCSYVYSHPALVRIGNAAYDLWSKDSPLDAGNEPNLNSTNNYWNSPDIWNNTDTSAYSASHQNPVHKTGGGYNRIFTRVRNRGTEASPPAMLYLYWSLSSTGHSWPKSWHTDGVFNSFTNRDPSSPYYNNIYPLGSRINHDTIIIPPLGPGADTIIGYNWQPPNPLWYHTSFGSNHTGFAHNNLCFLSRIVTSGHPPYGMTYPEIADHSANVKNNNNIVTKNVYFIGDILPDAIGVLPVYHFPVAIGGGNELQDQIRIRLGNIPLTAVADYTTMYVELDDSTYSKWTASGSLGSGFIPTVDPHVLEVASLSSFEIGGLNYDTSENSFMTLIIQVDSLPRSGLMPFEIEVKQLRQLAPLTEGAVYISGTLTQAPEEEVPPVEGKYEAKNPEDIADGRYTEPLEGRPKENFDENMTSSQEQSLEEEKYDAAAAGESTVKQSRVSAYPNPFSTQVYFRLELAEAQKVHIELHNTLGAKVATVTSRSYNQGVHVLAFDTSMLSPGVYFCRISTGTGREPQTLRLVIAR